MSAIALAHPDVQREQALAFLQQMKRIRAFELKCAEKYSAGDIRGFLHLYIGEEAVATGVIAALEERDAVVATYREHGHALARGMSADACMAEMYGRVEGCSRGRGGSMHLFDGARRFYGGNAIVGGGLPLAAGLAWGDKRAGNGAITACFFGEGAVSEGEFHEALNLAALWRLPVLFCCENNGYAMGTALDRSTKVTSIAARAATYGMPGEAVDGMDVFAVHEAASRAVAAVRSGAGPWLLELRTYRFRPHSMFDPELYRDAEEVAWWKERGPIVRLRARLEEEGWLGGEDAIDAAVAEEVEASVAFAEAGSDEPVDELERFVLAEDHEAPEPGTASGESTEMSYREAVRAAISEAMDADERVFLVGEDVGAYGGCYAVTKGMLEQYGPERIVDAPLSEAGFVGAGIGAAIAGQRPIVEIMTVNFSLLALDQLLNTAATLRHMSGGQCGVPLVVRMATGAGKQLAAQHSHSLEGWYAHIPGLKVLAPATVQDARGMLAAALADPDPVLIFEHVMLYNRSGPVDAGALPVDICSAAVRREGHDVSLITYGGSLPMVLEAAETLGSEGISAEVLDLRVLRPLDEEAVLATARKTGRVVVVDEGWRSGSLSAEVAARIQEHAFYELDAPVQRVCSHEVPMPYPKHLEDAATPSLDEVLQAARQAVGGTV